MELFESLLDFEESIRDSYSQLTRSRIINTLFPYKVGKVEDVVLRVVDEVSGLDLPRHKKLFNLYVKYEDPKVRSKIWEIESTVLLTHNNEVVKLRDEEWSSQTFSSRDPVEYMNSIESQCM